MNHDHSKKKKKRADKFIKKSIIGNCMHRMIKGTIQIQATIYFLDLVRFLFLTIYPYISIDLNKYIWVILITFVNRRASKRAISVVNLLKF